MARRTAIGLGILLAALLAPLGAGAVVLHDERMDGDLSDQPSAPTQLGTLPLGEGEILGQTVRSGSGEVDRDYLTFTVGAGAALTAILLNEYEAAGDNLAFVGLYEGSTASTPPGQNPTLEELLGGAHINSEVLGDIFPLIEDFFGEDKFDRPLGPGDYTLLIQQTGPQVTTYGLGLVAIPEPATLVALALGLIACAACRRRSARRVR